MPAPVLFIVDDDALVAAQLSDLARKAGFAVETARDGREALDWVEDVAPDIVVADRFMPHMSGDDLVLKLRTLPRFAEVPVMIVTSDDSRAARLDLLGLGADDVLVKPVDPDEFLARVRALARRRNLALALYSVTAERDDALQRLAQRNVELERLTLGLVAALERANALNDDDTGNHIRRVSAYARLLARAVGCDERFVEQIGHYAGLHDVGKVGIRDAILKKPGQLTPSEREEMKTHTTIGADLLRSAGLPAVAWNIAEHHHEWWDGTGYPHGIAGAAIPLEARIVAVVDVFDALLNKRCYKPAFDLEEAQRLMDQAAGSHLDPQLVSLFFARLDEVMGIARMYADELAPA